MTSDSLWESWGLNRIGKNLTIRTDSLAVLDLRPDDHLKLTHRLADVLRTAWRDHGDAVTIHSVVEGFGGRRTEKDVSPAGLAKAHRIVGCELKTLPRRRTQTPKLHCAVSDPDRLVRLLLRGLAAFRASGDYDKAIHVGFGGLAGERCFAHRETVYNQPLPHSKTSMGIAPHFPVEGEASEEVLTSGGVFPRGSSTG
jgi:hypothetical protein